MVTNQWLLNFLKMFPLKESILSWFSVWKAVIVTWLLQSLMQCVCIRHCPAWTEKTTKRTITQINIQIIKELLFVYLDIYEFIRFWIEMSRSILGPAQTHLFIRQTFIKSPSKTPVSYFFSEKHKVVLSEPNDYVHTAFLSCSPSNKLTFIHFNTFKVTKSDSFIAVRRPIVWLH